MLILYIIWSAILLSLRNLKVQYIEGIPKKQNNRIIDIADFLKE